MDDETIVSMFWSRNEDAIPAAASKYGAYCMTIARSIVKCDADAEECVNDTYLHAWNAMPPQRPMLLGAFLGRITRNLSFNRWRNDRRDKRGGGEIPLILEELGEIASDSDASYDAEALGEAIDAFLAAMTADRRRIFIRRYWYSEPVAAIASRYGMRADTVSMILMRQRRQLRQYLEEGGFSL